MQLTIDIGNSRSKMGLFKERELIQVESINNEELLKNRSFLSKEGVNTVILSSVNQNVERRLGVEKLYENMLFLTSQTKLPIFLAYESPETLGKDRIASVVGAEKQFPEKDLLVIDAGTCITYDFLTAQKQYLGGAISPGIQMRLKAMNHYTDGLPLIEWGELKRPQTIGTTTITSMLSGAVNGIIEEMKGFAQDYEQQYPGLQIVLTGGDANFFEKELKNGIFADPNLVLKGLNEILIYNNE